MACAHGVVGVVGFNADVVAIMQKRFVLHYEQGMTTKRIADLQGVSEYTVKKDIVNARRRLKKYFEE